MSNLEYIKGGGDSPPENEKLRKDNKNRTGSKAIVISCVFVALLVLLLLSPIFNVSEIRVFGNERLDVDAVIRASGIVKGANIFKVNPRISEAQLETMAYVDKVDVKRKFPSVVEIRVTENKEIAYVYFIGNYVGIDEKGKILDIRSKEWQIELPVILGTNLTEFGIGNHIKIDDEKKQEAVFEILKQLEINGITPMLKDIDVFDLNDIKFFTASECTVNIGTMDDIIYKIAFLKEILNESATMRGAVIDMTNPEKVMYRGS